MNEIELTEQFQTKDALIKRLKEEYQSLFELYNAALKNYYDVADAVAADSESPEHLCEVARNTRKQLREANEDAERLNEHLGHGMGCISWYNPMRCDCGCQDARKAHEERIT